MPAGVVLDKSASVWRATRTPTARGRIQTQVFASIRCAITPISTFDQAQAYRYQSTHILIVEHWVDLRKEDEIRYGRRLPDSFDNLTPEAFVVQGRKRHSLSVRLTTWYCKEGE